MTSYAAWTPAREPIGACWLCGEPCLTRDEDGAPCHLACGADVVPVALPAPTGTTTGPCTRCGRPHERYGDKGAAWCTRCRGVAP